MRTESRPWVGQGEGVQGTDTPPPVHQGLGVRNVPNLNPILRENVGLLETPHRISPLHTHKVFPYQYQHRQRHGARQVLLVIRQKRLGITTCRVVTVPSRRVLIKKASNSMNSSRSSRMLRGQARMTVSILLCLGCYVGAWSSPMLYKFFFWAGKTSLRNEDQPPSLKSLQPHLMNNSAINTPSASSPNSRAMATSGGYVPIM